MFLFLVLLIMTVALSFLLTDHLSRPSAALRILDHPNERSLHDRAIPRTGGIAILVVLFAAWGVLSFSLQFEPQLLWIIGAALSVGAISLLDDFRDVSPLIRVAVHLAAAGVLMMTGVFPEVLTIPGSEIRVSGTVAAVLCLLLTTWMINLFNFMDGMDGFAGGMAAFGFATYAILGLLVDAVLFSALSAVAAAAALGFLRCNFPPARIFMGDTGASTLGFLIAAMTLWAVREEIFSLWIGLLVFSPFVADATVTIVRRAFQRERIWRAHRSHYYQRLVQSGWGHKKTVVAEYGLMTVCGIAAVCFSVSPPVVQQLGIVVALVFYALLIIVVHRYTRGWQSAS